MKKLFSVMAIAIATTSFAQADEIRFGVEGAYPPFSWKNADGSLAGFDIEIANALCEAMAADCVLVEQEWDGMIPALKARKFDAILASMSITEERKKQVDFSDKYYYTPAVFVAAKDADFDVSAKGLDGKTVAVQRGTTHQCFMEKLYPEVKLRLYATQEEAFLDLASGRVDVTFSDAVQADESFLAQDENAEHFARLGDTQHDEQCHGLGAGIALRKGQDELRERLNAAIQKIREDGTYAEINAKYFDFDLYGAPSSQ